MSNEEILAITVFVLGVGGLVVLLVWLSRVFERRRAAALQALADQLGFTLEPRPKSFIHVYRPRANGQLLGRPAAFFTYTTGSGKSQQHWVALTVRPAATGGLTFSLSRQGMFSRLAELLGAREVEVGDPAFDARWFIRTNRPEFVRAALLPELRSRLTTLDAEGKVRGEFFLKTDVVEYRESGSLYDAKQAARLIAVAEIVAQLAAIAEVGADQPSR